MNESDNTSPALSRRAALMTLAASAATVAGATTASADTAPGEDELTAAPQAPDDHGVSSIPLSRARRAAATEHIAWTVEPVELVALSWSGESAVRADIRVRSNGSWSSWVEVAADGHGSADQRAGTEPLWVGSADAVELVAATEDGSALPGDLRVELVHPDRSGGASTSLNTANAYPLASEPLAAAIEVDRPWIRRRSAWGADESIRQNQDGVEYGDVRGMFVHHTATSNNYDSNDVPAIIRSIYRYHVLGRDFYDIGYNFLIDRFGKIWEGAYGGIDRAVIAAHTKYYNSQSFGVAAIGNFQNTRPTAGIISSYRNLVAWKFALHGIISAYTTGDYTNDGAHRLPVISGHRDTKATACPGAYLYSRLSDIRSGVHDRITRTVPVTLTGPGAVTRGAWTRLDITWRDNRTRVDGRVNLQRRRSDGRWEHVRQIAVSDGRASTVITPGSTNSYRLRASSTYTAGVDTRHPAGTSAEHEVVVVTWRDAPEVTLRGPHRVERGAWTRLHLSWISPQGPVTGRVNLQRMGRDGWVHIRQIAVTDGQATTVITPGGSHSYRLRASSAQSPRDVPTSHPRGTSNTYTVSVS